MLMLCLVSGLLICLHYRFDSKAMRIRSLFKSSELLKKRVMVNDKTLWTDTTWGTLASPSRNLTTYGFFVTREGLRDSVPALGLWVIIPNIPIIPLLFKLASHQSIFNNACNAFNFDGVRLFSNFSISWTASDSASVVFKFLSFWQLTKENTYPS